MLHGKRVTLRAVERDDIPLMHAMNQHVDLVLAGDGVWRPLPLAAFEKRYEKRVDVGDHDWFAIEADGKLIGDIELHTRDTRARVSSFGVAIYDPEYLGRGYGREAIGLLLDWAFDIQNYERIWLTTWATNERAIGCYRALGFVEEARLRRHVFVDGQYVDELVMGLLRQEWHSHAQGGNHAQGR